MNQYSCYLFSDDNHVTVKEITADFDVKAVFLARSAATEAGYRRFELRHQQRVVRREGWYSAA